MKKLFLVVLLALQGAAMAAGSAIEQGKALTFERSKGNCRACHRIEDGELPDTLGPPTIAENGRVVPVEVSTSLDNVQSISVVVEKNPRPLAAHFELTPGVVPELQSRIKMGQSSNVMVVVKTDSGLYSTTKEVKVTIGGCGG